MNKNTLDTMIRHFKGIVAALEKEKAPVSDLNYVALQCSCGAGLMGTYKADLPFDFTCEKCEQRVIGFVGKTPEIAATSLSKYVIKL